MGPLTAMEQPLPEGKDGGQAVDLPDDEYIPVMAIQAVDKERAVDSMDRVRDLLDRYRPDITSH